MTHLVPLVLKHLDELVRFREFFLELGRLLGDLFELLFKLSDPLLQLTHYLVSFLGVALHDTR